MEYNQLIIVLVIAFVGGVIAVFVHKDFKMVLKFFGAAFIAYIILLPITTSQLNQMQTRYFATIKNGKELNVIQKFNIYGYHGIMVTIGVFLYPEVSVGAFLMMFPTGDDELIKSNGDNRTVDGFDFFLDSPKLMNHFKTHKSGTFNWKLEDYELGSPEARTALTLNPLEFKLTETEESIFYELTVPMHYHRGVDTVVKSKLITIEVREDLFWYLARRGWLHEYMLTWTYTQYK
jgi:hypothetical protein